MDYKVFTQQEISEMINKLISLEEMTVDNHQKKQLVEDLIKKLRK